MRSPAGPARQIGEEGAPLVSPAELDAVELVILKRLREYTLGDHRSLFHGPGFDYVGLRTWEPGDRLSVVDWPQSSLNNFSPLVVRDFEQPGTASVVVVADRSPSTRCGTDHLPLAETIAWAVGTLGMSAAFFQDSFGLITFDREFSDMATVLPRAGRTQVMHCLDAYQFGRGLEPMARASSHIGHTIAGMMRRTSLIPVVSDFLFDDADEVLGELAHLSAQHDLFLVMVDAAAAFEIPPAAASWVRVQDAETGRTRLVTRRAVARLAARARAWQDEVQRMAVDHDIDVIRIDANKEQAASTLTAFAAERRLRKR